MPKASISSQRYLDIGTGKLKSVLLNFILLNVCRCVERKNDSAMKRQPDGSKEETVHVL
jgi:hypothetical protein